MKVEVRAGQLWEFTDHSGMARRGLVVRVSDPIAGVRHVYLRRVGSGLPMRATLHRLERQVGGARLVEDRDGPLAEPVPHRAGDAPKDTPPAHDVGARPPGGNRHGEEAPGTRANTG
jgi:hypothetical protein